MTELFERWETTFTNIEMLKHGTYPKVERFGGAYIDEPTIRNKGLFNFALGYRKHARFLMNKSGILLFEYQSMGGFVVHEIPLREVTDVRTSEGLSPADVQIVGSNGKTASFQTNDPKFFREAIMAALQR